MHARARSAGCVGSTARITLCVNLKGSRTSCISCCHCSLSSWGNTGTGGIHAGTSGAASFEAFSLAAALLNTPAAGFLPAAAAAAAPAPPPTPAASAASAAAGAGTAVLLTCTIARCSCLLYAANAALRSCRVWVLQGMLHSTAAGGEAAAATATGPVASWLGTDCRALSTIEPFLPLAVPEPLTDAPLAALPAAAPALDAAPAAAGTAAVAAP